MSDPTPVDTDILVIGGGIAGLVAALRVRRPETTATFPAGVTILEGDQPGGLLNWGGRNSFHIAGPKYKFTDADWSRLMDDAKALGVEWIHATAVSTSLSEPIKKVTIEGNRTLTSHAIIIATGAFSLKNAASFRPIDGLVTTFGSPTAIRYAIRDIMKKTGRNKLLLFGPSGILELARLLDDLQPSVLVEPPYNGELPDSGRLGTLERILGDPKISGVEYRDTDGNLRRMDCDTIYADFNASMEFTPATRFLAGSGLALDHRGFVATDRDMATNLEGVFAAGDVTGGMFAVSKSIYEGNRAGFSALAYLHRKLYSFEPNLHPFYYGPFSIEIGVFYRRAGTLLQLNGDVLDAEGPRHRIRYQLTPELIKVVDAVASAYGPFRPEELGISEEGLSAVLLFELVRIGVLGIGYGPDPDYRGR